MKNEQKEWHPATKPLTFNIWLSLFESFAAITPKTFLYFINVAVMFNNIVTPYIPNWTGLICILI
jgi:hypothetical protein